MYRHSSADQARNGTASFMLAQDQSTVEIGETSTQSYRVIERTANRLLVETIKADED